MKNINLNPTKKSTKSNKSSLSKLSPTNKNKTKKDLNFNLTSFKNNALNNIISSPKKNKEENISTKKKVVPYTTYHRKTKSSSQNFIQYQNLINDTNNNLNKSFSKISYLFRKNEIKINNDNYNYNNYNNNTSSRNRFELFKKKFNENKKSSNLLSISFSLKDFRNHIINAFAKYNNSEIKKEKSHLKNNKSLFILDNLNNIEETRNTTSITGFNNSILLYKKNMIINDNKNIKSTKYIKINKYRKQLFSPNSNSSKIINQTNNNKNNTKVKEKTKLYNYIYNHNNINIKPNKDIKNVSNKQKNLVLKKQSYKNSAPKIPKTRKVSFVNAISENLKLHYKNKLNNYEIKKDYIYNLKSLKSPKKKNVIYTTYKRRKNKSQENKSKIGVEYNNEIGEFQSVEEIHFIFVQMNQKKKAFFENNFNESVDV